MILQRAAWPIARQRKDRQGWRVERISSRRSLGLKEKKNKGERNPPRARNQASYQTARYGIDIQKERKVKTQIKRIRLK